MIIVISAYYFVSNILQLIYKLIQFLTFQKLLKEGKDMHDKKIVKIICWIRCSWSHSPALINTYLQKGMK